ncbi:mitochondrial glycoprotein [Phellopilus nigrolimitatus]|nr:mitochondrial glycoprotein [Phellopilus nigrolimitatus]
MSALRSIRNLTASSARALAPAQRGVCCAQRSLAFAAMRPSAQRIMMAGAARAFSVSARVRGEGATDVTLVQKLSEELAYEQEAASTAGVPDFVKDFTAQGVWAIKDVSGSDEVTLERTFGNETVRVMFSIADLDSANEPEYDSEGESETGEPASENITSTPIRVSISVTKTSAPGAINVDALCQDGAFLVENVSFYGDARTGTELTAEADWKRRGLYLGPTFENLDPGVQDEFERFLDERGVNESLALFIPDYAELKEQTEYVRWIESVKKFVEN